MSNNTFIISLFTIIQIVSYGMIYYLWKQNGIKGVFLGFLLTSCLYLLFIKTAKKTRKESLGDLFGTFGSIILITMLLFVFFTIFGVVFAKNYGLNIPVSFAIPIIHILIILLIVSLSK